MAEPKTTPTGERVTDFISRVADERRRKDCTALVKIMKQAAGAPPKMLGTNIIGFGSYPIQYAGGKIGEGPIIAFAPRKDYRKHSDPRPFHSSAACSQIPRASQRRSFGNQ